MKRVGISLVLLTLIVPLGLASTARADDKEDVAAAAAKWADAFSAETPDRVLALYDREAVLWGTLCGDGNPPPPTCHSGSNKARSKGLPEITPSCCDQGRAGYR